MAEELPEELKLRVMRRIMRRVSGSEKSSGGDRGGGPEELVWSRLSDDRARELLEKTRRLYPSAYPGVVRVLAYLIESGGISELDGYTVYAVLQRLGIPVRPETRIKFVKRGKEVDFKEYVGD